MPSVPTAVLLLVLSTASWQLANQQPIDQAYEMEQPSTHTDAYNSSTGPPHPNNLTLTTTAAEMLSSALTVVLSLSSSLLQSLPATLDSLHDQLSTAALSLPAASALLAGVGSGSTHAHPHDRTIAVLLFLLASLFVLLLVLACVTLGVWRRYAAAIAEFKVEWHSTRARHREKREHRREKERAEHTRGSAGSEQHTAAPAAGHTGEASDNGRQTSEQLYGFMSRARAMSEADEEIEMATPTVVVPGRDPFSQLRRKH